MCNDIAEALVNEFCPLPIKNRSHQSKKHKDQTSRRKNTIRANIDMALCEVCADVVSKYKCPNCDCATCSLACYKSHKAAGACQGCVAVTRSVPLSEFDNLCLLSDYRFLEKANSLLKSSRLVVRHKASVDFQQRKQLQVLQRECSRLRTRLLFFPESFHKHTNNTSLFNGIAQTIFWRIEFLFLFGDEVVQFEYDRVPDTVSLATILKQFLNPKRNSEIPSELCTKLREVIGPSIDPLHCYFPVESNGWTKDHRYYELCKTLSIRENLRSRVVVEYPSISVCLAENVSKFPVLSEDDKVNAVGKLLWTRDSGEELKRTSLDQLFSFMDSCAPVCGQRIAAEKQREQREEESLKKAQQQKEALELKNLVKQSRSVCRLAAKQLKQNSRQTPYKMKSQNLRNNRFLAAAILGTTSESHSSVSSVGTECPLVGVASVEELRPSEKFLEPVEMSNNENKVTLNSLVSVDFSSDSDDS